MMLCIAFIGSKMTFAFKRSLSFYNVWRWTMLSVFFGTGRVIGSMLMGGDWILSPFTLSPFFSPPFLACMWVFGEVDCCGADGGCWLFWVCVWCSKKVHMKRRVNKKHGRISIPRKSKKKGIWWNTMWVRVKSHIFRSSKLLILDDIYLGFNS